MWETIRGYLTFTRKERYGVLFLLLLISIFFILPYLLKTSPGEQDPQAYNKIKADIKNFESHKSDSLVETDKNDRYPKAKLFSITGNQSKADRNVEIHMFYFDPNKIHTADWVRLGLTDRLSETIHRYLKKGGHFHKAEDLKKIYGMSESDYERLFPFVRISILPGDSHNEYKRSGNYISTIKGTNPLFHDRVPVLQQNLHRPTKLFIITDVNASDSNDWSGLPGIGEKLASRIIHFREKLGGFYQVDQVAETYGLPDTTFQKIKPYLRIGTVTIHQIDVNTVTKEILALHPYIRWPLARSITEYRLQHGLFHTVDELLQIAQMDPARFEKLKPYLTIHKE
jgi:DNA uptake protein ComE-like DNA-binding protein